MATYRMNAYLEFVYGLDDGAMVTMFRTLENTELRLLLSLPVIIYKDALLYFYAHASVTSEKKISYTFNNKTYNFDEASLSFLFYLPN